MKASTYLRLFKEENKSLVVLKSAILQDFLIDNNSSAVILVRDNKTKYYVYKYSEIIDEAYVMSLCFNYQDAIEEYIDAISKL